MKHALLFLIFLWPYAVSSQIQILPEQVFVLGEHYLEDKCEVQFYPTWSRLIFLPKNKFYLSIAYGRAKDIARPSDRQMGNYKIAGDTLYLNFTKAGYELSSKAGHELPSDEYNPSLKRRNVKLMSPKKFLITYCGERVILRNPVKEFSYGSRDFKTEAAVIHDIYHDKYYAKVREELSKF